jgi:hypothetical protein
MKSIGQLVFVFLLVSCLSLGCGHTDTRTSTTPQSVATDKQDSTSQTSTAQKVDQSKKSDQDKPKDKTTKPEVFTSKEHGFSVVFAEKPRESKRQVAGQQISEFVAGSLSGELFFVAVAEKDIDARDYLNNVPDLLPNGLKGNIILLVRADNGKHAGVEVVVEAPGGSHCRYRAFKLSSRTFFVVCSGKSKDAVFGDNAKRFFDSFVILPGT